MTRVLSFKEEEIEESKEAMLFLNSLEEKYGAEQRVQEEEERVVVFEKR